MKLDNSFSWQVSEDLIESARAEFAPLESELKKYLEHSDQNFNKFGGDPSRKDWSNFRPLRLSREEDWSDWLAFLIESSNGFFIQKLLQIEELKGVDGNELEIFRESASENFRADLLILSKDRKVGTHIEVKVGDLNLEKTFETSLEMEKKFGGSDYKWKNYILLPESDVMHWESLKELKNWENIQILTWNDISKNLRDGIVNGNESILWKSWAYPVVGVIEQKLLRCKVLKKSADYRLSLNDISWMLTLKKVLMDNK